MIRAHRTLHGRNIRRALDRGKPIARGNMRMNEEAPRALARDQDLRTELEAMRRAAQDQDALVRELRNDRVLLSENLRKRRAEQKILEAQLASASTALSDIAASKAAAEARISETEAALHAMMKSTSWRVMSPGRAISSWLRRQVKRARIIVQSLMPSGTAARATIAKSLRGLTIYLDPPPQPQVDAPPQPEAAPRPVVAMNLHSDYQRWIRSFDELNPFDRSDLARQCTAADLPSLLVIFIFDPASARHARATIQRLKLQLFERWQAWLSFDPHCAAEDIAGARAAARDEPRIKVVQAPIADMSAEHADCVLIAAGGVLLREHALGVFAAAAKAKDTCLIYSDEDRLDPDGERIDPFFKPGYSPELWRRTGYVGPCILVRGANLNPRALVEDLNGSRSIASWAEDILHQIGSGNVIHVPFVLYHDVAESRPKPAPLADVNTPDDELPDISIIIPTKDRIELLKPCLDSIAELTRYPASKIEIIVVDNGSTDPATVQYMAKQSALGAIRVLLDQRTFNFSRLNNFATLHSRGEILVFLNNDTIVNDPTWLREIAYHARQDDVGAVGSKLLFLDRTVQHGGVILGLHGLGAHAHVGLTENEGGYHNFANETHEMAAVTAACLAIRRKVFDEVGGFDTHLEVAFSDVLLCAKVLEHGYRNIYIGRALLLHLESKTRGYDDTFKKKMFYQREAMYARSQSRGLFREDPYYNPNLSLHHPYGLAFPPRRRKPWRPLAKPRILMLSSTCEIGHGVAVVMHLQAEYLAKRGHDVLIGGPRGSNEFSFAGCRRIYLNDPAEAATYAVANDVDCIVAHTPPFFSVVRSTGDWPKSIMYDYGEPDPNFFNDADMRRLVLAEKRFVFTMAHRLYAISRSVRAESGEDRMSVIRLGNAHLATWTDEFAARRDRTRMQRKWTDKVVVLNVCRFHKAERAYKGVDRYALILDELTLTRPTLARNVVFVLCGKATGDDVREMEAQGLTVCANVSDTELIDLYSAADIYMNFSLWEGYNLGIGQALAVGLPVIASDIPAHREFGISTSNDPDKILELTEPLIKDALDSGHRSERKPVVWTWDEPLAQLAAAIEELCREEVTK